MPVIRTVPLARPFAWLALGWRDLVHTSAVGLLHGAAVMLGGWLIMAVAVAVPALLPGAVSGFALIAPLLATGLYETSRRLAAGQPAGLAQALAIWRREAEPAVQLGLWLAVLAMLWVLVSVLLVGFDAPAPDANLVAYLRLMLAPEQAGRFVVWLVLGGTGAAIVFCITAVSLPLLLEHRIELRPAVLASVKAVGDNPVAMALWAGLIMLALLVGMATLMIGLVVLIPLLGHATWHCYHELVDASDVPERP